MPLPPQTQWILRTSPVNHAEFTTHSNYVKCLSQLSSGITVSARTTNTNSSKISPLVRKKKILIDLTKSNLDAELAQIQQVIEYSQICISWIPVKSYYLFFNLLMLLLYFTTDEERWLSEDHGRIHTKLKDLLRTGNVIFSVSAFNKIHTPNQISSWVIPIGNNIVINSPSNILLEKQVIKKMFIYAQDDYKRVRRIKSLRGKDKVNFLTSNNINLCEFFYAYRLKANYRDMEFVNSHAHITEFYDFYANYYKLTMNFYNALKTEINRLSQIKSQVQAL